MQHPCSTHSIFFSRATHVLVIAQMTPSCIGLRGIALLLLLLCISFAFTSAFSTGKPQATNVYSGLPLHAAADASSLLDLNSATVADRSIVTRRRILRSFVGGVVLCPATARASYRDPQTGTLVPSVGEIEAAIPSEWDASDDPRSRSFARLDSSPDTVFYSSPRFGEHVDAQAVESMTAYISDRFLRDCDAVLDLCSSWTSHVRSSLQLRRLAGLGMNAEELATNALLTERTVLDLNAPGDVRLPYDDASFDAVLLQLSVDYLVRPLDVLRETSRVLRPGGRIAVLFSNRLFLSKAVGLWTGSDDVDHAYTVGSYLQFSDGGFMNIRAEDLSTRRKRGKERVVVGDPLYVVTATKG